MGKSRKLNRIGQVFGRLTVIAEETSELRADGNGSFTLWLCLCKCGNKLKVRTNNLVTGSTKSCGCLKREVPQLQSKLQPSVAGFLRVYRAYKVGSSKRGLEFSLSQEQFKSLTQQDCHYCGTVPKTLASTGSHNSHYYYNGIDRKDNSLGYILSNCLPCCETCNKAKGTQPYAAFKGWIERLVKFHSKD